MLPVREAACDARSISLAGVATGSTEICRPGTTVLHLQVFWALSTYHLVMAEQLRLFFEMQVEGDQYVDLAACLTAANRKQYHQVKKDGTPLCYAFTISSVNGIILRLVRWLL